MSLYKLLYYIVYILYRLYELLVPNTQICNKYRDSETMLKVPTIRPPN